MNSKKEDDNISEVESLYYFEDDQQENIKNLNLQ